MDMSKYIDRAKLMGVLTEGETQKKLRSGTGEEAYMAVLGMVNFAPAADVAPVAYGEWLLVDEYPASDGTLDYDYVCSECGFLVKTCAKGKNLTKFCPNCGAKMDGDTP